MKRDEIMARDDNADTEKSYPALSFLSVIGRGLLFLVSGGQCREGKR